MAELRTAHQQDPFWSPESIAAQVTLEALAAPSKDEVTRKQADRLYRVEAWPPDFGKDPLCHVLSQIIEHAARTPILEEDTAKLDEKARTNLQRWTAKTHEELRLLRQDADSLSYDAAGRLLPSDKTDGFLKQRLFPLIDRWDALFGCGRNQVNGMRKTEASEGSPSETPFTPHTPASPSLAFSSHRTDHSDREGALAPARATSGNSLWESKILLH